MLQETLIKLYKRDLGKLREEIEKYSDEADLWRTTGEIANSAGNLALHLVGNLNHFFGAVLAGSNYVRDRDAEFSRSGFSKQELLSLIDDATPALVNTLKGLTNEDLAKIYPIEVFGHPMTTEYFLVHLATHFNYHLGQINYHRRLLSDSDRP